MQEKIRSSMAMEITIGAGLLMCGVAAMLGELNTSVADVVLRLWPLGLVGLGVALVVRRS